MYVTQTHLFMMQMVSGTTAKAKAKKVAAVQFEAVPGCPAYFWPCAVPDRDMGACGAATLS